MKRANLIKIIVLTLLLALIAGNILKNRYSTLRKSDARLTCNDTAAVAEILVFRPNDTLHLYRQPHGKWMVSDSMPANMAYVNFCLRIFKSIKISSVVPRHQWPAIRDSLKQHGVAVKLADAHNTTLQHIFLYSDKKDRKIYALRHNATEPFIVELTGYEGNFAGLFYLPRTHWYQPLIIHYAPAQLSEITVEHVENPAQSFTLQLVRGQKPILLDFRSNPRTYNDDALKAYLTFLRNVSVDRYIESPFFYDSLQQARPLYRIHIAERNGTERNLAFYPIHLPGGYDKNYCYVLATRGLVGILPYYRLDPITRPIDFFSSY
jgi:hypothetical protein